MEGLLNALLVNPLVDSVYFNDKGGWLLHPNVLHPHRRSREEVLYALQQTEPAGGAGGDDPIGGDLGGDNVKDPLIEGSGITKAEDPNNTISNALQQTEPAGGAGGKSKKK